MSIERGSDKDRYPQLAELLRSRRDELGLSRKEVCALTGLSYPYVSQLESGYRVPSLASARKLADALALPVDDIASLATDTPTPPAAAGPPAPRARASAAGPRTYANPAYVDAIAPVASAWVPDPQEWGVPSNLADVVARAAALLDELPAEERLDALAELQRHVFDTTR